MCGLKIFWRRNHFRTGKQSLNRSYTGKESPWEMNWGWCDCKKAIHGRINVEISGLVSLIQLDGYRVKTYAKMRAIETGSKGSPFNK